MHYHVPWGAGATLLANEFSPTLPVASLREAVECFHNMPEAARAQARILCDVLVFGKETLKCNDIEKLVELL